VLYGAVSLHVTNATSEVRTDFLPPFSTVPVEAAVGATGKLPPLRNRARANHTPRELLPFCFVGAAVAIVWRILLALKIIGNLSLDLICDLLTHWEITRRILGYGC